MTNNTSSVIDLSLVPPSSVDAYGTQYWKNEAGELHREGDLPAVVLENGTKMWFRNNMLHRDNDLPAVIHADGSKEWLRGGLRHRDGGNPASISSSGIHMWYLNGIKVTKEEALA